MPLSGNKIKLTVLTLLLGLVYSCAAPPVRPPEVSFYVTPLVTYLFDSPRYESNVLGTLYRGDKVEKLEVSSETSWWQIKVLRSGQTGWIQKELLSSDPVSSAFYYVNDDTLPLLECPRSDCLPLQLLFRGEQVQRVAEGPQGWWRILVLKSRSIGWVPVAALVEQLDEAKRKQAQYYYVAVRNLTLRAQPTNRGNVIRILQFNDQVQKLAETEGWLKVRQPSSGAMGWVRSRDLETLPLTSPRGVPPKNEPKPFKQKEEPEIEPEFI